MTEPGSVTLTSTLTCPACGHARQEIMPADHCLYFYTCGECGITVKPLKGDCCVFCSFGDVLCPPKQTGSG